MGAAYRPLYDIVLGVYIWEYYTREGELFQIAFDPSDQTWEMIQYCY